LIELNKENKNVEKYKKYDYRNLVEAVQALIDQERYEQK
jgi:hypothetical protein